MMFSHVTSEIFEVSVCVVKSTLTKLSVWGGTKYKFLRFIGLGLGMTSRQPRLQWFQLVPIVPVIMF